VAKITHRTACWYVDCSELSQLHQQPVIRLLMLFLSNLYPETLL